MSAEGIHAILLKLSSIFFDYNSDVIQQETLGSTHISGSERVGLKFFFPHFFENTGEKKEIPVLFQHNIKVTDNSPPIDGDV